MSPDKPFSLKRSIKMAGRHAKTGYGFTLLELIVVLVLISVMAAFVGPKLTGSMSNMGLKTACKTISASLRYARSRATSERIPYAALFDFENNRLTIEADQNSFKEDAEKEGDDEADKNKPRSYLLPDGVELEKAISGGDEFDSEIFKIVFFPAGCSSGGDVILRNERKKRYKIGVDYITGAVQLEALHED